MLAPLIDTHCHLADRKIRPKLEEVLARASDSGIGRIIAVGAIDNIETDRATVEIAQSHDGVYAVVGVHPHNASDCSDERIAQLRELIRNPRVVAIGETGLDFHYMHSPAAAQEQSLRRHLELAREFELPIVIHCRNAEARLAEIVQESGIPPAGGVIHCFTGDSAAAMRFVSLGFHISFSGIVTFRNAAEIREAARLVPSDRLLVETDSPYLAPEPHRGKTNEPAYVRVTAERIAAIRNQAGDELCAQIVENAVSLFRIQA